MTSYLKNPKLVVILGHPLEHTFSPVLHNFAFQMRNLDYFYSAFPLEPDKMHELGTNFLRILPFAGGNVTIPFKEKIFNYLDKFTPEASLIGAVNTFYKKDGFLWGDNTDMYGFLESVKGLKNYFSGKKVLMLGTGGSAKAVSVALAQLNVNEIVLVSRAVDKAAVFAQNRSGVNPALKWTILDYHKLMSYNQIRDISVVINTTPIGMYEDVSPLPEPVIEKLSEQTLVYDLIYNPGMTRMLKLSQARGLKTVNGIDMLINQASKGFKLWTGHEFPLNEAIRLLKASIK